MPTRKTTAEPQDFRALVKAKLGERSVYWLAGETKIPQPVLSRWLGGKQATLRSTHLGTVFKVLGINVK